MGFVGGMGAFLKSITASSHWLMLALPLLCIGIMILFTAAILFTNGILVVRALSTARSAFILRAEFWSPLALSVAMILGLILFRSIPGQQEIPVTFHASCFLYPILLMIVAFTLRIVDKNAEQVMDVNRS